MTTSSVSSLDRNASPPPLPPRPIQFKLTSQISNQIGQSSVQDHSINLDEDSDKMRETEDLNQASGSHHEHNRSQRSSFSNDLPPSLPPRPCNKSILEKNPTNLEVETHISLFASQDTAADGTDNEIDIDDQCQKYDLIEGDHDSRSLEELEDLEIEEFLKRASKGIKGVTIQTNHQDQFNPKPKPSDFISKSSKRPSALDFDLPPPTPNTAPMSTLEPAFYSTTSSIEPEKRYSHLSGLDFLRALLTDIKTVDRTSFNYLYVISPHSQAPLNTLIDRYLLAKLLWGPGKREINKSKSFNFGHLKLLGNLKDEFVENKWICRIEFVNESCARLAFDNLKYNLNQKFNESKIQAEEKIQYECFNHSISSEVWTWEEISEKGMIEAEWLAMKKPKDFHFGGYQADRQKRKVHFQPEQNLLQPVSRPSFLETKLEINHLLESITLETILQILLSYELLPGPLPIQIRLSKAYRKCQLIFTDTVPCKIAYLKIFQSLKVVKEKSILEKLGSCADCLIPDHSQLDHDENWSVWNHAVEWNTDQISNFAQSIRQPMISNPCTINSNLSTHQSESYDPSSFALPKKWQIQIVLGSNLPIIQDPISANLRSFLLTNVIRHPSSQGFFNLPYSVHLGTEGGSRFRTMVLIFYKLDSHKMTSKDEIKLEPDGEILRRQLKEVCHKFNCTEHLLTYGKRKIRWQYLDLAYSSADRTSHYDLYKELHNEKKFKLMIHQIGFNNSLSDPSDNTRNDLSDDIQLRYRNLFAIPGGFKNLSRRHRGRTNSNAATLLDDEIVDTTDSGSSLEIEKTDGEEEIHHERIGFERVENQDYRAIKEQLEDEIFELECKKNEPEEGIKSLAFESAQSVSDRRRIEIQEKQRRTRQGRRRKRRKASEDVDESEESKDEEEGGEIDWQKRKRRMRKIRGMNDEEDETDSTGIITNPNFITNTEAIARRHARPPEREPGAVL